MAPRLTAPTSDQILAQRERDRELAWGAKHAPGPELAMCDECARDLHETFGDTDGRKLCRHCIDFDKWTAGARAYAAYNRGR